MGTIHYQWTTAVAGCMLTNDGSLQARMRRGRPTRMVTAAVTSPAGQESHKALLPQMKAIMGGTSSKGHVIYGSVLCGQGVHGCCCCSLANNTRAQKQILPISPDCMWFCKGYDKCQSSPGCLRSKNQCHLSILISWDVFYLLANKNICI